MIFYFSRSVVAGLCIVLALSLGACSGGGGGSGSGGGGAPASLAPPALPALGSKAAGTVTSTFVGTSATVELPGQLSVALPEASLASGAKVKLSVTSEPRQASMLEVEAELVGGIKGRQPHEFRINIGSQPTLMDGIPVTLTLPADFAANLGTNDQVALFAQLETEDITHFEAVACAFDPASRVLTSTLDSAYFKNGMTSDGTYEAVLIAAIYSPELFQAQKLSESIAGYSYSYLKGYNSPLVNELFITDPISGARGLNGKPHKGYDLRAADGTEVLAVADGKVFTRAQRVNNSDPDSELNSEGFGYFSYINHPDGSTTLYAHLQAPGISGVDVVKGQVIALSGHTGGAEPRPSSPKRGPHLHFELIPRNPGVNGGPIPPPTLRADPVEPIQLLTNITDDAARAPGSISTRLNDSVQLYALDVSGPGTTDLHVINVNSKGEPISLKGLTWAVSANDGIASIDSGTGLLKTYGKVGVVTVSCTQKWSGATVSITVNVGPQLDFTITGGEIFSSSWIYTGYVGNFAGYDCEWNVPGYWGLQPRPDCNYPPFGAAPGAGTYEVTLTVKAEGTNDIVASIKKDLTVYHGPGMVWSSYSCAYSTIIDPTSGYGLQNYDISFSGTGYMPVNAVLSPSGGVKIGSCGSWTTFTQNNETFCRRDPGQPVESSISGTDKHTFYTGEVITWLSFGQAPAAYAPAPGECAVNPL